MRCTSHVCAEQHASQGACAEFGRLLRDRGGARQPSSGSNQAQVVAFSAVQAGGDLTSATGVPPPEHRVAPDDVRVGDAQPNGRVQRDLRRTHRGAWAEPTVVSRTSKTRYTTVRFGNVLGSDAEKMDKTGHEKNFVGRLARCEYADVEKNLEMLSAFTSCQCSSDVREALHRVVPEMQADATAKPPDVERVVEENASEDALYVAAS
jgi:hypothetical protein